MKYICAHCGHFSACPQDGLIDSGQVWKCDACDLETIVDLNTNEFRKNLYALYSAARRAKVEASTQSIDLPAQYKIGELEVGMEPWRGNWSIYVKSKKETMWFRDPVSSEAMARARAAVLAGLIREGVPVPYKDIPEGA
jgi:hypothetical protein